MKNKVKITQPPSPLAGLSTRTANCVNNCLYRYDDQGNLLPELYDERGNYLPESQLCPFTDAQVKPRLLAMLHNGALLKASKIRQEVKSGEAWRNFGKKTYIELSTWLGFPPTPDRKNPTKAISCPHCGKHYLV